MSCVSWGRRPVSSVITCMGPPVRAAMSMRTDDSAWKLATIASFGNEACAHRSTASGSRPDMTSGGITRSIGRGAYPLERFCEPDRPRDGLLLEQAGRADPGLQPRRQVGKVGEQAARHHDRSLDPHLGAGPPRELRQRLGGAVDDANRAWVGGRVEDVTRERRPLPRLVVALQAPDELEHVLALRGREQSLAQRAYGFAALAAAHELAQGRAHHPRAAALVTDHPTPSACPGLVARGVAGVGDRSRAGDHRDARIEARGRKDEARVVHHHHARARQQPGQQLLEPASGRGNLRAGGACAANGGARRSELADETGQPLLHQLRVDQGDVGAWRLSLGDDSSTLDEACAARAPADVETEDRSGAHQVRVTLCSARGASGSMPRTSATWFASSWPSTTSVIGVSSSGSPLWMRTDDFASSGAEAASNNPTTAQL